MKATAPILASPAALTEKSSFAVYAELFKARLTLLVLLTTMVGYYMGCRSGVDLLHMMHTLLGTALVASGASALNQLWERNYDARMRRTADRPLPSGRLQPQPVLRIGCLCAGTGLVYLAVGVNLLTALLGAVSLLTYVFLYTPLKRVTWLNTAVGAIPGGLPPLMGWAAARGELGTGGWVLFGVQALWQLPHFMAIAWLYRDEYAKAGFKMLPVLDPEGQRTGWHAVAPAALLLPVSVAPFLLGLSGVAYLCAAILLGLSFLWLAVVFARRLTAASARHLFYLSLIYLPLLLTLLVADKIR
jgi:protoheme IX farnesyltransferase